jgi:multiple sugar transport system ATP-binding protein
VTPQELYDTPVNVFVGGFVGSPAMNFFDATVTMTDSGPVVVAGKIRAPVQPKHVEALQAYVGKKVILGIRPEDIHDPDYLPPDIQPILIDSTVDVLEAMGSETYLHLVADGPPFIARVDARSRAALGEAFKAAINVSHLHLFDPESELAL